MQVICRLVNKLLVYLHENASFCQHLCISGRPKQGFDCFVCCGLPNCKTRPSSGQHLTLWCRWKIQTLLGKCTICCALLWIPTLGQRGNELVLQSSEGFCFLATLIAGNVCITRSVDLWFLESASAETREKFVDPPFHRAFPSFFMEIALLFRVSKQIWMFNWMLNESV